METKMITEKQIAYLNSNKFYQVMWANENITMEDAKLLCSAVNPYDGNPTYWGYKQRTKKEIWLPNLLKLLLAMCEKYSVKKSYIDQYQAELEQINLLITKKKEAEKRKRMRIAEAEKRKQIDYLTSNNLVLSTQSGHRLHNVYLDGHLEALNQFDLVYTPNENLVETAFGVNFIQHTNKYHYQVLHCYVKELDELAFIVYQSVNLFGRKQLIGLVISEKEYLNKSFFEAYDKHIDGFINRL